jgi:hypothetical protein
MTGTGKTYRGDRTIDGCEVLVDGEPLDEALSVRTISDDGFEWSYEGAGPAQLALAILYDHLGDAGRAIAEHEGFMRAVVANFNNEWEMTGADIDRALANIHAGA